MRLLKLRIENINSLAGRYEIDFTNRDYVESGIFAIVGPTGSGKTTILDAVTLALFGKTPRMDIEDYERDRAEKKLLMKLQETEEAVKDGEGWLSIEELKEQMGE